MGVKRVSASDFRVHLKDYANLIASGRLEVIVERHGFPMAAVINVDEYEEFCRWKAARQPAAGAEATGPQEPVAVPAAEPADGPADDVAPAATAVTRGAIARGRLHIPKSALSYAETVMFRTHPDTMELDLVEDLYQETRGATNELIDEWRHKAYHSLRLRGRQQAFAPWDERESLSQ